MHISFEGFSHPTVAASLVGKFGFLCSTLFGKIGRASAGPVRARRYSSLNPQITKSVKLMEHFAVHCKPRSKMLNYQSSPLILCADASDVECRRKSLGPGSRPYWPKRRLDHPVYLMASAQESGEQLAPQEWAKSRSLLDLWRCLPGESRFIKHHLSTLWIISSLLAISSKDLASSLTRPFWSVATG